MTLRIPNGYGIATYHWTYIPSGKSLSITMGFWDKLLSDDPTAAATNHRAAMTTLTRPANAAQMSTRWRFEGVTVLLRNFAGMLVTGQNLTPVTGTFAAPANDQPIFAPWVITKQTAFAGKAHRGRYYPPMVAVDESSVDAGGLITGSVVVSQQTLQSNWLADTGMQAGYPPYLLHTDVGLATPVPNAITSVLVRPVTGLQRRRRTRGA